MIRVFTRYTRQVASEKNETDAEIFLRQNGFKPDKEGFGVYKKGLGFFRPPFFMSVDIADKKAVVLAWKNMRYFLENSPLTLTSSGAG